MTKNKKSTIGSTLAWMIAIFIILAILLGYFLFMGLIYKSKGASNLALLSEYSSSESSSLTNFLTVLSTNQKNGKSIMDDLEAGDTSSFRDNIIYNGKMRSILGVACFQITLYVNDIVMQNVGNAGNGAGYTEEEYQNLYFKNDKKSKIRIRFYGGKCL